MNVLEVQGLTKRYPAFTLNGVSFAVPHGTVMGFIGRNGAGKSTTLKSILGMVHPDAGEVKVFGMDYAANERAIRRELGVVLGGVDFSSWVIPLFNLYGGDPIPLNIGLFINNVVNFLVLAVCVFGMVKAVNRVKREKPAAPPAPDKKEELLEQIRDLLAEGKTEK